ncbi:MAG: hypothetical protein LH618_19570, partial [Saprospiraceae bacterium]|nr:hypothetical protein [Saprospiraceae bacterium]
MNRISPSWLLCSLLLSFSSLSAQSVTFQRVYGGTGNSTGHHVIVAEDGYLIAGQTTAPGGDLDAYLLRVNT